MRRRKENAACLKIHVLEEASPNALQKTRMKDTPRVDCTRNASHILGFLYEKFGDFLPKPNTQDCVRHCGRRVRFRSSPGWCGVRGAPALPDLTGVLPSATGLGGVGSRRPTGLQADGSKMRKQVRPIFSFLNRYQRSSSTVTAAQIHRRTITINGYYYTIQQYD